MIPKIIHYCWFGRNKQSDDMVNCISSWKKFCPDYEIIEWNEDNFDINSNRFVREAYENKKWAFITDYVRLFVLNEYGGIYLDSDVEIIKPIDKFLTHRAFSGFEDNNLIPTGLMASEKKHPWIVELLDYYYDRPFVECDGSLNTTPNTKIITEISKHRFGFSQHNPNNNINLVVLKDDINLYPWFVFCPKSHLDGKIRITDDSYAIHHFAGSWLSPKQRLTKKLIKAFVFLFGRNSYEYIKARLKG